MTPHELFMQRALSLAARGIGQVSPNPQVGCVIVHGGKIIGEGWHQVFGGPHAEVNAINAVEDKALLSEASIYVTLEPCSHTGKTPPCTDLLIQHNVKKVVVAMEDPNPLVSGRGIQRLKDAAIEVEVGLCSKDASELNKRFILFMNSKRPYIVLKWAQTSDGFIAPASGERRSISNDLSRQLTHKWRAEEDSILIGSETALRDNPSLDVRDFSGRNPKRIVIDRHVRLRPALKVFDRSQNTICYNLGIESKELNLEYVKLAQDGFLPNLVSDLYSKGIQSVMVEGGAQIHKAFIEANLWDEAKIFYSPINFNAGVAAAELKGQIISEEALGNDWLEVIKNNGKA